MATVQVNNILNRVSVLLQDSTNIRWPLTELLDWLNDGQRDIALFKPNSCVRNTNLVLAIGTKQALPADGNSLIGITRNVGGNAVRIAAREILDAQLPDWHSATRANIKVVHYCYNANDPKTFYVFPPSPGGNSVEIIYSASPADATLGGLISVDDIYSSALVDYVAYRAYSKDSEYAVNAPNATAHYQAFLSAINGKTVGEVATAPNTQAKGNPNI